MAMYEKCQYVAYGRRFLDSWRQLKEHFEVFERWNKVAGIWCVS